VKNSNVHAILSDLHRLLSQYTRDDFTAASRYSGVSKTVRAVLLSLAREAAPPAGQDSTQARRREILQRGNSFERRSPSRQAATTNEIADSILRSPRFHTSRAIVEYALAHGLTIQANPKDGRERLARRLAAAAESASDKQKSDLLAQLDLGGESQTQGWIGVIKSPRR
jgi:hypothetical protein